MIYAICVDLMDRSKITGALDDVRVVRPGADLSGASTVIVDLALGGALEAALTSGAQVVAYGSHVDETTLAAARAAGADAMPRSVFFRRLSEGTLL